MDQTSTYAAALDELGVRMWAWRVCHQPRTRDDIPRVERTPGWLPDFSAETVRLVRAERETFATELAGIDAGQHIPDLVDRRLLHSLLARVRWELDVVRAWQSQPRFYVDQALGTIFDALLPPGVGDDRVHEVLRLLTAVPRILADGKENLTGFAVGEFAGLAIEELADIDARCTALAVALAERCPALQRQLDAACSAAAAALIRFREWLIAERPTMAAWQPVGAARYREFLREVAVLPFEPQQLLAIGELECDRATVLEQVARNRQTTVPSAAAALPVDAAGQAAQEAVLEGEVRAFYTEQALLSQPAALGHYLNAPMPAYLEPLRFLGVADDLTSATRLEQDGLSYVPTPTPALPYFYAANAIDPRAGIVHEGAHYQQLALSWSHPRPLRQHFYDSGPNEGIAFYNEELMLAAGLFDDAPQTRAIIYNFMRLRALRVAVDVGLATGTLSIEAAANYLATEIPMDRATAAQEAADFAEGPGQAISYQIGKTQILALIADALRLGGRGAALQPIHDYLWRNGNVPIALLRWELLGLTDQLDLISSSTT